MALQQEDGEFISLPNKNFRGGIEDILGSISFLFANIFFNFVENRFSMINRIILIGNGFDLAHGLKTSYKDFLENYWSYVGRHLQRYAPLNSPITYEDVFVKMSYESSYTCCPKNKLGKDLISAEDCQNHMAYYDENFRFEYKSKFFEKINRSLQEYNWVDVEYEYYLFLKKISEDEKSSLHPLKQLNLELKFLQNHLVNYLKRITSTISANCIKSNITNQLFERIKREDISFEGQHFYSELVKSREMVLHGHGSSSFLEYLYRYGKLLDLKKIKRDLNHYASQLDVVIAAISSGTSLSREIPDGLVLPDNILFLNFNYTNTSSLYMPVEAKFKTIHIHGDLEKEDNPIIFGYGDEMDKSYKEILDKNDNSYLENIKSMHYAETDNYRNLLQFIESAPYQIYIMGHSCGNSDRTLLNTLFEHKNCISIKPFYHEWDEEGVKKDDYLDKIQNISRNFNDMALMRDRVVNKTYCEPLG